MDKDKINAIIEKLVKETKNREITWHRLNTHPDYNDCDINDSFMFMYIRDFSTIPLTNVFVDKLNSYYLSFQSGYLYLFLFKADGWASGVTTIFNFAYQSSENAKLRSFSAEEKDVMRLYNIVEDYVDNNESFLNSLLDN